MGVVPGRGVGVETMEGGAEGGRFARLGGGVEQGLGGGVGKRRVRGGLGCVGVPAGSSVEVASLPLGVVMIRSEGVSWDACVAGNACVVSSRVFAVGTRKVVEECSW